MCGTLIITVSREFSYTSVSVLFKLIFFLYNTIVNYIASFFSDFFYVRNHLPVPQIELKDYTLELAIEGMTKKTLNFKAITKYEKKTITAAVMCGGNRRSEMSKVDLYKNKKLLLKLLKLIIDTWRLIYLQIKHLKGINWSVGAVGNATWTGVRLCDVLKDLGINEDAFNHVQVFSAIKVA